MKILNSQDDRDWELDSACHYIRVATQRKDISQMVDAELNLKDILRRHYT